MDQLLPPDAAVVEGTTRSDLAQFNKEEVDLECFFQQALTCKLYEWTVL